MSMDTDTDTDTVTDTATDKQSGASGFATVDEKGRISLPKQLRAELGVHPGSSVAYVVLGHSLLIIPQDEHLASLTHDAVQALAAAGVSVQDILDELPAARADVMREMYSPEFLRELDQLWQAQHPSEADETDR